MPGHGVAVWGLPKLGPGGRGDRVSSGKDSVTFSEACTPLATEAHSRGRAGVGQAGGLKGSEEGCLYDAPLGNMPRTLLCWERLLFLGCGYREVRMQIPGQPQSWLSQVKELPPRHIAAKPSAGIQTHSAGLGQLLPRPVSFLCSNQSQKSSSPSRGMQSRQNHRDIPGGLLPLHSPQPWSFAPSLASRTQ